MARLNVARVKDLLQAFDFPALFVEELGWDIPPSRRPVPIELDGEILSAVPIAELGGVVTFEIEVGSIPDSADRAAVHRKLDQVRPEHVIIFLDALRTSSCWSWEKREGKKKLLRDHLYYREQSGAAFIAKIGNLAVDLSELNVAGKLDLRAAAQKVKDALDVQQVVRKFYEQYKDVLDGFVLAIEGIDAPSDRLWYASVLLNRLMFVYFLQKGQFLDGGDLRYLENRLDQYGG